MAAPDRDCTLRACLGLVTRSGSERIKVSNKIVHWTSAYREIGSYRWKEKKFFVAGRLVIYGKSAYVQARTLGLFPSNWLGRFSVGLEVTSPFSVPTHNFLMLFLLNFSKETRTAMVLNRKIVLWTMSAIGSGAC